MMSSRTTEILIQISSDLKKQIVAIVDHIAKLGAVIEREHAVVSASDLKAIDEITKEKMQVGAQVSKSYEITQGLCEQVRRIYQQETGVAAASDLNLSLVVSWLRDLVQRGSAAGFDHEVLSHVATGLDGAVSEFQLRAAEVKPKIEMNAYLTRRLLENHRQTVGFWQELLAESEATYTPAGITRKTHETAPVLRVKA